MRWRWPAETEAAFRASVAWYQALDESAGPRGYFEFVDDEGAHWLWETLEVGEETVAVKQVEVGTSGVVRRYSWRYLEDEDSGLTDQALDLTTPGLTPVSRSAFYAIWDV